MMGLTAKQQECLEFIIGYVAHKRIAPSYSEIATALGISSKSGVVRLMLALEERGLVRPIARRARAYEIVKHTCPHCGGDLAKRPARKPKAHLAIEQGR